MVRIEGRIRERLLELAVIDDGPGLKEEAHPGERRGVGLRNTRERLNVLYGERCRFMVLNTHPGLRVEMALPLETATIEPSASDLRSPARASGGARA